MKELSIEEKAKRYDGAIDKAKKELDACGSQDCDAARQIFRLFPEIKESGDERIRKRLIFDFKVIGKTEWGGLEVKDILAWLEKQGNPTEINPSEFDLRLNKLLKQFETLPKEELASSLSFYLNVVQNDGTYREEKQGEQKPVDKVEPKDYNGIDPHVGIPIDKIGPKFKVGDWITNGAEKPSQISSIEDDMYYTHNGTIGGDIESMDKEYHLWTIQDVKEGDVLVNDHHILILKELDYDRNGTPSSVKAYCDIDPNGNFEIGKDGWGFCVTLHIHPATNEQWDTLFTKMKEAGYKWDAEKKELKKIYRKPIVKDESVINILNKENQQVQQEDLIMKPSLNTNQEWSEEDKKMCQETIDWFEKKCFPYALESENPARESIKWLKSLRLQKQWKPSEMQIMCLQDALSDYHRRGYKAEILETLLKQLKQL